MSDYTQIRGLVMPPAVPAAPGQTANMPAADAGRTALREVSSTERVLKPFGVRMLPDFERSPTRLDARTGPAAEQPGGEGRAKAPPPAVAADGALVPTKTLEQPVGMDAAALAEALKEPVPGQDTAQSRPLARQDTPPGDS
jgi:hypothetical protein